jgi:hypothetical protein
MVWINVKQNEDDKLIELHIIMDPENQTLSDIKNTLDNLEIMFSGMQKPQRAYTKPAKHTYGIGVKSISDTGLKTLANEIIEECKTTPLSKAGRRQFSVPLKKKIVQFVNIYKTQNPDSTYHDITKAIGIHGSVFGPWTRGKFMSGKRGPGKKRSMKYPTHILPTEEREKRNRKIVAFANKNPYHSWTEIAEEFKMSTAAMYQICKKSKKVKIMKRPWEKLVDKSQLHYRKNGKQPIVIAEKRTPVQAFLKFNGSNVSQGETIKYINECIAKGSLTYRDDAHKFGYDRRSLPSDKWFKFITDVAKKTNNMIGVEVTLSDTMTGLNFKK